MTVDHGFVAEGDRISLRRIRSEDLDLLLAAHQDGDWLDYDAPFERRPDAEQLRARLEKICAEDPSGLPQRVLILDAGDGKVLGMLNRYGDRRFATAWWLGIDLFAAAHWGRGLGAEALKLWIDLLFERSEAHRLGLNTWSLNPRMIKLATKLGFRPEGVERELVEWRGEWLNRHSFGLLRSEWAARRSSPAPEIRLMAPAEAAACEGILRALPDWFGIPAAIDGYRQDIESMETFVLSDLSGFLTLKSHGDEAAEIQVMAVLPGAHRRGLGRRLVEHAERELRRRGCRYLQVKTLAAVRESEHYARTRRFYVAMGFAPLEVFPELWGTGNPCLLMVKGL